ncbi:MAG: YbaK/EbsC family protein [Desulfuromonadales bacterium]|jgi:Ala-tRNA(Pro) deacylase
MAMAITLREFFDSHPLAHDTVEHEYSLSGLRNAETAHLPGDMVAKSVLLHDGAGYLLAVVPATHRLDLGCLHKILGRHVGLATEEEIAQVFGDCEIGAIPPAGLIYDIDTIVDEALLAQPEIYFEAGDHETLIHMNCEDFRKLVGDATRMNISHHM